ncbi:GNAT family N-acetyltransferase [uncultured Brachyspira sp.]|uniref:GNAT family N-acetyltransferase n=1 Tax=uncultured Brachyspira sp. TaxID=221953 RepID=UPI0025F3519C|nr:GNAT family N-acetyltransferase [uncultured Brachyspira sp.]
MDVTIKKAEIKDVFDISKLHAICWKDAYKDIIPHSYLKRIYLDDWCGEFEDGINNKTREAHIAYIDNNPIGVISHGKSRSNMEGYGEIISLYIHPIYQGSGIGSLLLEHAVKYIKDLGYSNICLCVFDKNEKAKKFYEKNGFKYSGKKNSLKIGEKDIEESIYIYNI